MQKRRLVIFVTLLALLALLAVAAPAWADSPGIMVITGWGADNTGLSVPYNMGSSRGQIEIPADPGSIPAQYQEKLDSVGAIEAAYNINGQVMHALGTLANDYPIAYSSGLIAYMARVGFNPAVVGGPNIPPGSVTSAMMPNGYLLVDQVGSDGWAVQLSPGQTPAAMAGAVSTPAPQIVSQPSSTYVKPQPSEIQTKPTPREAAATSPSIPAPGKGSSSPQALAKDQQGAAALHVPLSYVTNPPAVHYPKTGTTAKSFPWKWVYIGGGLLVLLVAAVVVIMRRRQKEYPVW